MKALGESNLKHPWKVTKHYLKPKLLGRWKKVLKRNFEGNLPREDLILYNCSCGWRELFCEPFQACHLQGPRSHQRSCCCARCFSKKFIHNHTTSFSTSLHAFHKVFHQTTSLSIYLFINLALLIWHQCRPHPLTSCHPAWALVELAKWMQEHVWEVILHE